MAVDKHSLYSVTPVWALITVGAIVILALAPKQDHFVWLSLSLAAGIILTFCIQLGLDRKDGLVNRVMASLGGSVLILAVATGLSAAFWLA